ncbi:MAG TPA: hypothetical protein PLP22_03955 [Candidatus Competibacter sp.]|nr:hypothetical protein [Candidatus Competibacteraceae bacterium]HRE53930.1 hypothetical protein [Candidatus Competibacter sp.]HUM94718.1 hypothetical protein [Candidatus Competibacter sp.]
MKVPFGKARPSWLHRFKSPWFYWHTGYKAIAVSSMILSLLILWLGFAVVAGFSIWGVIVAVLLDALGLLLVVLYLGFFRAYIPDFIGLQTNADAFVIEQLLLPMLVGFFLTRAITFFVARARGYSPPLAKPTDEPPP